MQRTHLNEQQLLTDKSIILNLSTHFYRAAHLSCSLVGLSMEIKSHTGYVLRPLNDDAAEPYSFSRYMLTAA